MTDKEKLFMMEENDTEVCNVDKILRQELFVFKEEL